MNNNPLMAQTPLNTRRRAYANAKAHKEAARGNTNAACRMFQQEHGGKVARHENEVHAGRQVNGHGGVHPLSSKHEDLGGN